MTRGLLPHQNAARALVDWLEASPAGPLPFWQRVRLGWGAFWFERLLRAQKAHFAGTASAPAPSFVMGFWRSGTTLLHNLLYARFTCAAPLTWQCHSPASFALQPSPRHDLTALRPMDDGVVHLLGPHEDEFALLLLGELSLYRGFLDPTRLGKLADACLGGSAEPLPRWMTFIASLSVDAAPLLLKSPNHVFRLETIAQSWPNARAVWICRSFTEVLASNLRMWSMMIDLHRLRPGEADLTGFFERAAARYRDIVVGLLEAPRQPMLWLDYADLIAAPDTLIADAAHFLGLKPREAPLVAPIDARVYPGRTASAPALPSSRLEMLAKEIDALHAAAIKRWGCKS